MKSFVVFALLAAAVVAAPPPAQYGDDKNAEVLKNLNDNTGFDKFSYEYQTSNGISGVAEGQLKQIGNTPDDVASVIRGSYSYTAPDGLVYTVTYVADENGFQPQGAHIPK